MTSDNPKTNTIDTAEDNTVYQLDKGQTLVKVSSIRDEKVYIGQQYPDFEMLEQKLIKMNTGSEVVPVDLIRVNTSAGEKIFYFDVSELFKQYGDARNVPSTDYNKIYDNFCLQVAKHWQQAYPGMEVPKFMIDMLFMKAVRTFSDNKIIENGLVPPSCNIPQEMSDKGVNDFIAMAKSTHKSEEDKALIKDFILKTNKLYEYMCKNSPKLVQETQREEHQNNTQPNKETTDFDVLRDFITTLHYNKNKNTEIDIFTCRYIEYWCQIHIEYVQNKFPPARLYLSALGDQPLSANMIIDNVIKNMQKTGTHFTMGDLYSDMFMILAPGISKDQAPKIHPSDAKKSVLSEMCNPKIFANFCAQLQGKQKNTPIIQQREESPIYGLIFVLCFIGILAMLMAIE